ncbi:DEAD/DEAH box helicase [Marinobacterium weihaiense]|uniref:DEAD/DEAH box helicase n=1 Tax=Marinobacterium weihaiense TaxID=2851016 RepID=A0ABS6MDP8_9GAMM|nr:DEAD/DEAH box helicase [Marinobacterium weihaiense]MBV0934403.1 DEAD/DEAH box helicase [Marinobacterium weihaiense]
MSAQFIPGMRVEIRDAEWRIQRVDRASDGGFRLHCIGLSELVRGRESLFLSKLEQNARILDPVSTELVDDLSSGYRAAQLYIGTALRQTPPTDERVYLGHEAAMDVLPFQLDPVRQALQQPRQRILIADSVGLGKTLEAGILTSELIRRGRGKRILVLATKSMLGQFQQEFWQRFTIPLVRLDSVGLQRVRNQIPTNHNPFHYFDRAIISIDTLKQTLEYRHYLEQAYWDIIIIDEAHNVARRSNNSQRHQLAELLSTRSDTLVMLSATPHDGKPESFASLMNMLDPTAIANPGDYAHEDFRDKGLVIRRFKQDVAQQLATAFPQREIKLEKTVASAAEEQAYRHLAEADFHSLDSGRQTGSGLFRTTLEKALFSSPAACMSTVENRLKRLQQKTDITDEIAADISQLEGLALALRAITPEQNSKYRLLLDMLKNKGDAALGWKKAEDDRLVIFTESLQTLDFLEHQLQQDLKLKKGELAILKGTMRDTDLADIVDQFNRRESKIRLLLCSDVASEGINLHHLSHRMVHYDIPWSLMVFQQRNGRIDRYGQTRQPQIRYLMTESTDAKVRGDQRILEVLVQKDEQAGRNIGDPSEFMGLFSQEAEEAKVTEVMETRREAEPDADDLSDLFDDLFGDTAEQAETALDQFLPHQQVTTLAELPDAIAPTPRLYPTDLAYAREALNWLSEQQGGVTFSVDEAKQQLDLTAPVDLQQRIKFLPREIQPEDQRFILSTDKQRVQQAIKRRRDGDDTAFSAVQYLWPLHPVMEWLQSRVQDAFGRHTAPVVRMGDKLGRDEHWFIVQGGFPNKRGQALIQATLAVQVRSNRVGIVQDAMELLQQLKLNGTPIANPALAQDTRRLQQLLKPVVASVRQELKQRRDGIERERHQRLNEHLAKLEALRNKHVSQLELQLERSDQPEAFKQRMKQDRMHQIEKVFTEYQHWLAETQHTETDPYIQIVAVLTGQQQ